MRTRDALTAESGESSDNHKLVSDLDDSLVDPDYVPDSYFETSSDEECEISIQNGISVLLRNLENDANLQGPRSERSTANTLVVLKSATDFTSPW
jgi:hypothetical protein